MVRKPFVAGNWKMNLDQAGAAELVDGLLAKGLNDSVDVAVCPAFVHAASVGSRIADSVIGLGCQDVYFEAQGAFTGEISCSMLKDIGCRYVILGHSERRHVMGETDEIINKKVKVALESGLTPIVCVGETLEERESGTTMAVIESQFKGSLEGLSPEQVGEIVIAYEPVWAIGTGKVATPEQAEEVHSDLRKLLETSYNAEISAKVRIQYGGSVKPGNAADLLSQPNIDGALVGGASLKADDFAAIVTAAQS
ncbi:MAG: triose-phosphate isomerase [Planctomycetota bacterium]|nr:triose-phosphate isomerase [Planctomycetota bacterium]